MRYFRTSNASRRYLTGALAFIFEPVENIGGTWLGVLAVEESAAKTLTGAHFPQVVEITADEYEGLKKKPLSRNDSFREQPTLPSNAPRRSAVPAANASTSSSKQPASAVLKTATLDVPDELKLETGDRRR